MSSPIVASNVRECLPAFLPLHVVMTSERIPYTASTTHFSRRPTLPMYLVVGMTRNQSVASDFVVFIQVQLGILKFYVSK
jgi:hypothetical protein